MHRDNTEIPFDEFIDILNEEKQKGRIKIFGGSNWTIERFKQANNWAKNNNKALSKMINLLWVGCISSNDDNTLEYLQNTKKTHLSWSSQGRGYLLSDEITKLIEDEITKAETWRKAGEHSSGHISCFDSPENQERERRTYLLTKKLDTTAQNIACAWPLNLKFPSFALFGLRKIDEINSSLKNLSVELTYSDVYWLNLKEGY